MVEEKTVDSTLDAQKEFSTEVVEKPAVEVKAAPAAVIDSVKPEEMAALKRDYAERVKELEGLKSKSAVLDKLAEVFAGKSEDPKDAFVRKELQRLVPELSDIAKIKEVLPMIVEALGAQAEEKVEGRAGDAVEIMQGLMTKAGLDAKDKDACGYVEEALTREIRGNKDLTALWASGRTKDAVNKAFEKVSSKLFAPIRANTKRAAVSMQTESPKAGPIAGTSVGGTEKPKVDLKDTSREGTKKIHDAAYERLMELTEGS